MIFAAATLNLEESGEAELHTFTNFPDSAIDEENDDTDQLIEKKKHPAWSFAYYKDFFDVDTNTVLNRVKRSILPLPKYNFNSTYMKGKPDMYGPFWVCATVVVCFGVCGNLTSLIHNFSDPKYTYAPQFYLLPIAGLIIYSYAFILPLLVKAFLWWRKIAPNFAVSNIICIYGYSLFIFIPASLLFIIPSDVFDWIVLSVATLLSGCVIIISMWPAFEQESKKFTIVLMFFLFALHAATMVLLKLYFFIPVFIPTNNNATLLVSTQSVAKDFFSTIEPAQQK